MSSSKKTLLDFFKRSPSIRSPEADQNKKSTNETPTSSKRTGNYGKRLSSEDSVSSKSSRKSQNGNTSFNGNSPFNGAKENEECESPSLKPKRRRLIIASDSEDSEDEYKPPKESIESDDNFSEDLSDAESSQPKKKKIKVSSPISLYQFNSPKVTALKSTPNGSTPSPKQKSSVLDTSLSETEKKGDLEEEVKEWLHLTLDWLKDGKIKDRTGKPKSHPSYDSRTLYVPESFLKNLTPAMKQWWDMKSRHFDTVLFFKVGKFYEFYHMDAVTGVRELGLVYMKGEYAHSGFPEISYSRFADRLVEKGYKVARVEQTETPQMMEERCKKMARPTKFDKVVAREICQITTQGTRTFSYQDGAPMGAKSNFLLAVTEKPTDDTFGKTEYGVCFIDTSIGKFTIGQFVDDRHSSRIMTLIALYPPLEVLLERDAVTQKTLQVFENNAIISRKEELTPGTQFWDATKTLKFLAEKDYFDGKDGNIDWPDTIKEMLDQDDVLQQTALKGYELAVKALGACIWYLKECCIEDTMLTMKLFDRYIPLDGVQSQQKSTKRNFAQQHMVLDGTALCNLEILPSGSDLPNNAKHSLLDTLDFCCTNFGKRLFRHWLCSPLCNPQSISERLDAIDDLLEVPDAIEVAVERLKKIPDLERLLSKIHAQGLCRSKDHPDSRAVFYESNAYNKKKVSDFLETIQGFKESIEIVKLFQPHVGNFKSPLLSKCVTYIKDGGLFPELEDTVQYFNEAFDHEKAKKDGKIIPNKGVDQEFDAACESLETVQEELDEYLDAQRKKFRCKINYIGSGRTRFQLEIPDDAARSLSDKYEIQGQRKGFKRFYTEKSKSMLAQYIAAEDHREAALRDIMRRIFERFDKDHMLWKAAVDCLSVLDALISLQTYRKSSKVGLCRPEIMLPDDNTKPFVEILDGNHPSMLGDINDDNYIPNSVYIGPKREEQEENLNRGGSVVLVTGPNMGGKSTLMRQTGTLAVMAHMGSYVPAAVCRLTPIDRIFTRVGADDDMDGGESTFFVEASETASILFHATTHSLVLVDELGRGTSTHDGTAVANAVVDYICNKIDCRTLFSTHFHSLVEDFTNFPNVGLGHMACMVEDDSENPALEHITFLYKFVEGPCPKSYGFNVACLAGVSKNIVHDGFQRAKLMENCSKFPKLCKSITNEKISEITEKLSSLLKA